MKRVYCLYRVFTIGQIEKDDIPMQREACHEFAKSKGWVITEEFLEKGVSGFKVSSEDREALQAIKKAAIQKQFDILLVFMFDRLGRRDDENDTSESDLSGAFGRGHGVQSRGYQNHSR